MSGTSSKKYHLRGLGPKQQALYDWFKANPHAEFTTNQIRELGVVEIPGPTAKRVETIQSYLSERLSSLVERGMLYRRDTIIDGHRQFLYGYLNVSKAEHKKVEAPAREMGTTSRTSGGVTITLSSGTTLTGEDVSELLAFLVRRE